MALQYRTDGIFHHKQQIVTLATKVYKERFFFVKIQNIIYIDYYYRLYCRLYIILYRLDIVYKDVLIRTFTDSLTILFKFFEDLFGFFLRFFEILFCFANSLKKFFSFFEMKYSVDIILGFFHRSIHSFGVQGILLEVWTLFLEII